eukprot:superscaffoldBa00005106_g19900
MARDYAARCPVSPVRNTWLVAAAILLAAQELCLEFQYAMTRKVWLSWFVVFVLIPRSFRRQVTAQGT